MQNDERPMIPFQGSYTKEMLQRMTRVVLSKFLKVPWVLGCLLAFFTLYTVIRILQGAPAGDVLRANGPTLGVLAGLLALFLWILRAGAGRQLTTNKLLQEPMEGYVSEKGVYISTPRSTVDLPWDTLYRARVADRIILLGGSEYQYYMLPREFFASDEDWKQVCAWAEAYAPKPKERKLLKVFLIWIVIFVVVILLWNVFRTE